MLMFEDCQDTLSGESECCRANPMDSDPWIVSVLWGLMDHCEGLLQD